MAACPTQPVHALGFRMISVGTSAPSNEKSAQAAKHCLSAVGRALDSFVAGSAAAPDGQTPAAPERAEWYVIVRKQFDFANAGFTQATEEYASNMASYMSTFMSNAVDAQKRESKESSSFSDLAENISKQVAQQWDLYNEEEANSSSGLGILGYVFDAITIAIGILTEDPALIMMGIYGIVTQATGDDPVQSFFQNLTGNQIAGEFLAGVAEAAAGCGLDYAVEKGAQTFCKDAAEEIAKDVVGQMAKDGAAEAEKSVLKTMFTKIMNFLSKLGMMLMMSPFWQNVAAQIPGVGKEGALWLGLAFSIAFTAGASAFAEQGFAQQIVRKGLTNKFGPNAIKVLDGLTLALTLARNGTQIGIGVQTIRQGQELEKAADILRQLGGTQSLMTLVQGLVDMFNVAMMQTQTMIKTATEDYTAINGTLPSLGQMMDINRQQAV